MTNSTDHIDNLSMLGLFRLEVGQQSGTLQANLDGLQANTTDAKFLSTFLRTLHSLKGAARIVDLDVLVHLIQTVEEALSDVPGNSLHIQEILPQLEDLAAFFATLAEQPAETIPSWLNDAAPQIDALLSRFLGLPPETSHPSSGTAPPPASSELSFDLSLFSIFKEDAENHCAILNDCLLHLEEHPDDTRFLEASMRSAHSIKGAARVVGLDMVVRLAHAMEDLFVAALDETMELTGEQIDILLKSVDFFKDLVEADQEQFQEWYNAHLSLCEATINTLKSFLTSPTTPPVKAAGASQKIPDDESRPKDSSRHERHIKISSSGMAQLMGLTTEMLAETKWQPTLLTKSQKLKRQYETISKYVEDIRRKFHESHFDLQMEHAFRKLNQTMEGIDGSFNSYLREIEQHTICANEISHKLHNEMLKNKMQPFSDGIKGFPRMVRDVAKKLGKKVHFEVHGPETMVDRDILAKIESPLSHLVTNAIDHGIETVEERQRAGKPKTATLRMEARHQSGTLIVSLLDDGRGFDVTVLRETVLQKKLISKEIAENLSESELIEFVFLPNFSTKETSDHLSGRGVGLDLVQTTVKELRGSISVSSVQGRGVLFELSLPLTLSISRCLTCLINNEPYAFSLIHIDHVKKVRREDILEIEGRQYIDHGGKRIGILTAQQVLDLKESKEERPEIAVIILPAPTGSYGIVVDKLLGIKELMVHPIHSRLGKIRSVSSASITENGTPILIMDTGDIIQTINHLVSDNQLKPISAIPQRQKDQNHKRVLVVDDSATVREVEQRVLSLHGYHVITAADGLQAWHRLKQEMFDLVVTDIDMPHMDGIELLLQIREDHNVHAVPVIIVSYKERQEDRIRGLNAGADYYITKADFQEHILLDAVYDLIGNATIDHEKTDQSEGNA